MPDENFYRTLPVWGAGTHAPGMNPTGPGPGLTPPDYSKPRAAQAGESKELLPQYEGAPADVARENRAKQKTRAVRRMAPYLLLQGTVSFNQTQDNQVILGRPNKGYRWIVREFVVISGQSLTDTTPIALSNFVAAFYVGNPSVAHPGGPLSQVATLSDVVEVFEKPSNAVVVGTGYANFTKTYSPNQIQVLENQTLYAQLIQSGAATGTSTLFLARVEQYPTSDAQDVEVV